MQSTVLIIQKDKVVATNLASVLEQDGHKILPVVANLVRAYHAITVYEFDIAVIDGSLSAEVVERLSDMFTVLRVPHIISYEDKLSMRRLTRSLQTNEPYFTNATSIVTPPLTQAIAHAVWDIHVDNVMSAAAHQKAETPLALQVA